MLAFNISSSQYSILNITAMKRFILFVSGLGLALGLSGCGFSKSAVTQSLEINKSISDGDSKVMLLNVLRASEHLPPVFTGMSGIRVSSSGVGTSATLSIPFGGDADNNYGFTPSVRSNHDLYYDVAVFQTKEFMCGILSPIKPETFKYYWDMGWPKSLLLNLFVREVKYYEMDNRNRLVLVKKLTNYPMNATEYQKFTEEMNLLIGDSFDVVYREFCEKDIDGNNAKQKDTNLPIIARTVAFINASNNREKLNSYTFQNSYVITLPPEIKKDSRGRYAVFYLRSPEAIIYYLGEIVRAGQVNGYYPEVYVGENRKDRIFVARPDVNGKDDALVSVSFNDKKYIIPREGSGRSLEVISLLMQLVGQQKSSSDLPQTSTIRFEP